ncbi:hypothetical protein SLS62_002308 [Diatrype stigma]|uniref:Myb-like DNA-binding domain-containing protein n=1 Tax=Diatrype stigma TaxID=117547 RepID=A0AAN9UYK6_9PEZI
MSNTDNAMTRFLFAILRQKNLKDINWDMVASDPILAQEITNGHAARMRYSRFKTTMLGVQPTRRNRTNPPKSRVTKSKKDPKPKRGDNPKSESPTDTPTPQPQEPAVTSATATSAPKIKQENPHYGMELENRAENRLTPCLTPGPMVTAPSPSVAPQTIQPRFLTPCSEMMGSPPSLGTPPPFDFSQPPYAAPADASIWPQALHYDQYPNPYAFAFEAGAYDSPSMSCGLNHPPIEADGEYTMVEVKHETREDLCQ